MKGLKCKYIPTKKKKRLKLSFEIFLFVDKYKKIKIKFEPSNVFLYFMTQLQTGLNAFF